MTRITNEYIQGDSGLNLYWPFLAYYIDNKSPFDRKVNPAKLVADVYIAILLYYSFSIHYPSYEIHETRVKNIYLTF